VYSDVCLRYWVREFFSCTGTCVCGTGYGKCNDEH